MDSETSGNDVVLGDGSDPSSDYNQSAFLIKKADIVATGVLIALFAILAFMATSRAQQVPENTEFLEELRKITMRMCEEENAQNAEQKMLWEFILEANDAAPRSPEEEEFRQAQLPKVRAFIEETFAPKDCNIQNGGDD